MSLWTATVSENRDRPAEQMADQASLHPVSSDAEDSPVVSERGSADQFTAGVGLAYAW